MFFNESGQEDKYYGEIGTGSPLKTPFGTAKVDNTGYYRITTSKEGYPLRLLHVLIWENFYGIKKPDGYDIHHKNGDKLDNRIQNLQCIDSGLHKSYHKKGENHPNWKNYARVNQNGKTSNGKQNYALIYNGKTLKQSIHREPLEKEAEQINTAMKKAEKILALLQEAKEDNNVLLQIFSNT